MPRRPGLILSLRRFPRAVPIEQTIAEADAVKRQWSGQSRQCLRWRWKLRCRRWGCTPPKEIWMKRRVLPTPSGPTKYNTGPLASGFNCTPTHDQHTACKSRAHHMRCIFEGANCRDGSLRTARYSMMRFLTLLRP
jgi:hypothetical protein